ncbi:hypothetical protein EPUL_003366 [Erysiphe pulchra]|uniref:Uncharacterized protein n=1 Tax=Erysiphe pulchra TaxID=225359 RepID=A0A2S4PUW6_9PEZI|nr:hypothetical protein EPUL_003366 [Erysiphe pulchra]
MYDREGVSNRLQLKSFQKECNYSHDSPEIVEYEQLITSHNWLPPISSTILHPSGTQRMAKRGIPSIAEICSPYESSYSTIPFSREENRFKRSSSSRSSPCLQISEGLISSPNSPASEKERLHDVRLEQESQKAAATLNHPYSREQLHCVRYLKEDLNLPWNRVFEEFHRIFCDKPGFIARESEAALTSRSYRDNFIYASINNRPLLNSNGMPLRVQAKVRQRLVAEERHIPFKLVEKHPSWAVRYDWVRPEHRAQAQAILDGADPVYYNSKKDQHRRVIEKAEQIEDSMMGKAMDADLFDDTKDPIISVPPRIA